MSTSGAEFSIVVATGSDSNRKGNYPEKRTPT